MIIGLTGGIASGKSSVSNLFVELGAKLVDADQIAREVVLPGKPALSEIIVRFGQDVVNNEDGTLHRKKLGALIFNDKQARKDLEAITHPHIRAEIKRQIAYWTEQAPSALVIVDIPLLFESNLQNVFVFDEIILVYVPAEVQVQRLMQRDQLTEADASLRINAQIPIDDKRKLVDVIIDNSRSRAYTEQQVTHYFQSKVSS